MAHLAECQTKKLGAILREAEAIAALLDVAKGFSPRVNFQLKSHPIKMCTVSYLHTWCVVVSSSYFD